MGRIGDTYLQPVSAKFLNSRVVVKGEVAGEPGQKGKTILLDIEVHDSRMEDLLNLAVASQRPMLTGGVLTLANC